MSPIDKILASEEEGNKEEKSEMMQLVEASAKQVAKETVKEVLAEIKKEEADDNNDNDDNDETEN